MKSKNLGKIKEQEKVYNTVGELYNKSFEIIIMNITRLSDAKKNKLDQQF